jgi:hypothetical protein
MALTTKSPKPLLQQDKSSSRTTSLRVTVTGVDNGGQLFRDQASVVHLKGQECTYDSRYKPSADGSLMIEFQPGPSSKEAWRANAKVKRVSPSGPQQDGFRVTVELDRAHSVVIDAPDTDMTLPDAETAGPKDGGPRPVVPAAAPPEPVRPTNTVPITNEITPPLQSPTPVAVPAPRMMVADIVRSVMASELDQLRRELRSAISSQAEAAVREPLQALEAKIEQQARMRPAISEETVRKIAAQVAENVQVEWATTKLQKMIAEAVHQALASEYEQRGRELNAMVSSEIEAAVRGPVATRMDAMLDKALDAKMELHARAHPAITEETVRKIAAQVAENAQSEWAAAKLQSMVMETVRPALASEYEKRGRELNAMVSSEIEAAVQGPVAARINAILEKALDAQWAEYARTPRPITEETVRQIAARVAEHPQLQSSIDALAASLSERWAEVARSTSANVQQDVRARIAATEHLASEIIADIQGKLNSFGMEMERILDRKQTGPVPSSSSRPQDSTPEGQEIRLRELLQTAGSQFEREMKAALQRVFGKL